MTTGILVRNELRYAKGMVERRQEVTYDIGSEENVAQVWANYDSMLACLFECEKHHNNVMSVLDQKSVGIAEETSALVDWSRTWVRQCEQNLIMKWDVNAEQVYNKREDLRMIWEMNNA